MLTLSFVGREPDRTRLYVLPEQQSSLVPDELRISAEPQHEGCPGAPRSSRITHSLAGPPAHCALQSLTNVFRLRSSARSSPNLRRTSVSCRPARSRAAVQSRVGEPTSQARVFARSRSKSQRQINVRRRGRRRHELRCPPARLLAFGNRPFLVVADGWDAAASQCQRTDCHITESDIIFSLNLSRPGLVDYKQNSIAEDGGIENASKP